MIIHHDTFLERYPIRIRNILIGVLFGFALLFYVFDRFQGSTLTAMERVEDIVEAVDIPPTQQMELPPPPSRPSIPVESEDEDIAEDITIEETGLDDFEWDAPPPPPDQGPQVRFIPYDEAPTPIGGYAQIQKNARYPDMAREAGIEGTVIVQAFIDKNGRVTQTQVLKGIPKSGLNEAAVEAVKRTRFKPAKQRDRKVGVWISIPVNFRLNS